MKLKMYLIVFILLLINSKFSFSCGEDRGRGETIIPINDKNVELISAQIVINKEKNEKWRFEGEYVLKLNKNKKVIVGIPDIVPKDELTLRGLCVLVNNQKASLRLKHNVKILADPQKNNYRRVLIWPVEFKKNKLVTIKTTYSFVSDILGVLDESVYCFFSPISLWKGIIKNIKIVIKDNSFDSVYLVSASPVNYKIFNKGIEWNYENIDPKFDISMTFRYKMQDWVFQSKQAIKNRNINKIKYCLEAGELFGLDIWFNTGMDITWKDYGIKVKDKYLETMELLYNHAIPELYLTRYKITTEFLKNNLNEANKLCKLYIKDIEENRTSFDSLMPSKFMLFIYVISKIMPPNNNLNNYLLREKIYIFAITSINKYLQSNTIDKKIRFDLIVKKRHIEEVIEEINSTIKHR